MKRIASIFAAAGAAMLLTGCGIFGSKEEPAAAAGPSTDPRAAYFASVAGCAEEIGKIAISAGGDPASRVAAVGAIERLCGGAGNAQLAAFNQPPPAQPQSLAGALWQAALQLGDLFVRGYGIKAVRDVGIVQSNNMASTTIAGYQTFGQMGASIERAGTAGYPYVQAPGANYTLSGTGVLGSGTYAGPVTTTRTCTGGPAGNSGGTTGGAGGAGGPANC